MKNRSAITPHDVLVHGTCVRMPGSNAGVLLLGASGSGKSDLALRLLGRGCKLVADDQVIIKRDKNKVLASAPPSTKGLLEVRGIGITRISYAKSAHIIMVVQLVQSHFVERLPDSKSYTLLDVKLPELALSPFELSAVDKLFLAYHIVHQDITLKSGFVRK